MEMRNRYTCRKCQQEIVTVHEWRKPDEEGMRQLSQPMRDWVAGGGLVLYPMY